MVRNDKGEWCFFNREYTYLGSKDSGKIQDDSPFFVYMLILQMSFGVFGRKRLNRTKRQRGNHKNLVL